MDNSQILLQTITLAIAAGVLMQVLAEKAGLPSIVFLMIAGIALGPEFLGLIEPKVLGHGLEVWISLSVALILFEGGLSLDFQEFKNVNKSVRNMISLGLLITIVGSAMTVHYLMGLDWYMSALFGSFISITGITAIVPILRRVRVKRDLATILRSEAILCDPLGAFISVGVLEVILASDQQTWFDFTYTFFWKIFIGLAFGLFMGWVLGKLLKKRYIDDDLKNLVVLAWVFASFYFSNLIEPNTGILTVVIVGFAVQREKIPQLNTLKRFKGQLSVLLISILFILISANLDLGHLERVGYPGLLVIVIVTLIVRPLAVFLSNHGLLSFKDKIFVSWIGPKGIVSASVASLFSLILVKESLDDVLLVEALVYMTIMLTVTIQGLSARRVAAACDALIQDGAIAIVGANALGRTLGTAFKEIGKEVILIDSNIEHCRISAEDSLETVYGNCLDPNILEQANLSKVSLLIATSANSEVNFLVCQMAKDIYQVPEVYPAIDVPDKGVQHQLVDQIGGNLAYAKPVNIQDWKDAVELDQVKIVDILLDSDKGGVLKDFKLKNIDDNDWIPLILKRKSGYFFVHADQQWSKGDILIYLSK